MTATPTGRDRPGDRTDGPPTTVPGPGSDSAGRGGAGPRPGADCHLLACSFPLCEWPWCDDDLLDAAYEDDGWLDDPDEDDLVSGRWSDLYEARFGVPPWDHQGPGAAGTAWDHDDPVLFDDRARSTEPFGRTPVDRVPHPTGGVNSSPAGRDESDRGTARRHDSDRCDHGGATVEAAVALSALVVVLVLAIAAVLAVVTQIRLVDAAGAAARLAARGDDAAAHSAVDRLAPDGVQLSIDRGGEWTTVSITAPAVSLLPGIRLSARAVAATEGGSDEP